MRYFLAVALVLALSSCATRPVSNDDALPVAGERLLNSQYQSPSAGTGEVTVKRDSGAFGSACGTRIYVDATPIADINPSEKIVLYLPDGDHILSAWPNGICGGRMSEVRAAVKAGSHTSYRVGYGSNGDFSIDPTAF